MSDDFKECAEKNKIKSRIADLSKLLGMIPSDGSGIVKDPVSQEAMELSQWFDEARESFFKLSVLLDKTLGLNIQ